MVRYPVIFLTFFVGRIQPRYFFGTKIMNLYNFVAGKHLYPRIGAFHSPIMSTMLLSVIVYDFSACEQISDIFSIASAWQLLSWYSIIIIIGLSLFVILFIICLLLKRNYNNRIFISLKFLFALAVIVGCSIGVVTNIEMIKKRFL